MYRRSIFSPIQRHSYFLKKFSYTKEISRYKVHFNTFNYSYGYCMIFLRYRKIYAWKKQFANICELIDVATDSQWTRKVQPAADPSPIDRYSSVTETQFIRSASRCWIRLCKLERSSIDQYLSTIQCLGCLSLYLISSEAVEAVEKAEKREQRSK